MASPILPLGTGLGVPVLGNPNGTVYTIGREADQFGLLISAYGVGYAGTLPTTATTFQKGCMFIETDTSSTWINVGTVASPSWHLVY